MRTSSNVTIDIFFSSSPSLSQPATPRINDEGRAGPVATTNSSSAQGHHSSETQKQLGGGYTAFACIAFFAMAWIGVLFGIRIRHLGRHIFHKMNTVRFLVLGVYIFSMCLIFALGVLLQGVGIYSHSRCRIAITVCLVAYVGVKVIMALFLTERAHAMRKLRLRREDWVWIAAVTTISVGFGIIAVFAFWKPNVAYYSSEKDCQIGLSKGVAIGLLCYDLVMNVGLTLIFMWLLIPRLRFLSRITGRERPPPSVEGGTASARQPPAPHIPFSLRLVEAAMPRENSGESQEGLVVERVRNKAMDRHAASMDWLVKKTLVGLLIGLIPTLLNLALLLGLHGFEHDWLCFTLCTTDVTVQVFIVHWLTMASMSGQNDGGDGFTWT